MAELAQTFTHKLENTQWGTAVYAALIAAVVFLVLQMLTAAVIQGLSPMLPVQMIAALALGPETMAGTGFTIVVPFVALLIHLWLSIMTAWILAPIVGDMPIAKAVGVGAVAGLVIYLVNFHVLTMAFTWFVGIRGFATLINHLIFGAVLVWVYQRLRLKA
ncbi:MAG: hypothetical protein WED00_06535 [Aquisalimonadaceae bacterium]